MSLPPTPSAPGPSGETPAQGSPALGRVALGLGIATLLCGLLAFLDMITFIPWLGASQMVGVALGIATIVVAVIAIVRRRGRRHGIIGLVLALASAPLAWALSIVYFVVSMLLYYGI
ncbi:hypothetical protein G3H63_11160 [Microbacterium resistens]|uniref:hypothetical protein n=1 Tax=Microbacterium resistens TaxID=156977 RepID=UPI001C55E1B7|nr:hypothetical protein [Microbacterium resistens]MBW1639625.1 hypothetical protein [Microbacterium resistens]